MTREIMKRQSYLLFLQAPSLQVCTEKKLTVVTLSNTFWFQWTRKITGNLQVHSTIVPKVTLSNTNSNTSNTKQFFLNFKAENNAMKAKLQESQGMKVRLMCYLLKMTDNAYLTNYAAKTEASVLRVIPW